MSEAQKYAVIQIAGKQHTVREQDELVIDHIDSDKGTTITVSDVLLVVDGKDRLIGAPLVENATVTLELVNHQQEDKIRVFKFKSKSRFRKTRGHRQSTSTLKVSKISAS